MQSAIDRGCMSFHTAGVMSACASRSEAVKQDTARIALRLIGEPVFAGDIRQPEHLLSASIEVNTATEIRQLFLDFQTGIPRLPDRVKFHQTLREEPCEEDGYGRRPQFDKG